MTFRLYMARGGVTGLRVVTLTNNSSLLMVTTGSMQLVVSIAVLFDGDAGEFSFKFDNDYSRSDVVPADFVGLGIGEDRTSIIWRSPDDPNLEVVICQPGYPYLPEQWPRVLKSRLLSKWSFGCCRTGRWKFRCGLFQTTLRKMMAIIYLLSFQSRKWGTLRQ